jgi:hypothetical protein
MNAENQNEVKPVNGIPPVFCRISEMVLDFWGNPISKILKAIKLGLVNIQSQIDLKDQIFLWGVQTGYSLGLIREKKDSLMGQFITKMKAGFPESLNFRIGLILGEAQYLIESHRELLIISEISEQISETRVSKKRQEERERSRVNVISNSTESNHAFTFGRIVDGDLVYGED